MRRCLGLVGVVSLIVLSAGGAWAWSEKDKKSVAELELMTMEELAVEASWSCDEYVKQVRKYEAAHRDSEQASAQADAASATADAADPGHRLQARTESIKQSMLAQVASSRALEATEAKWRVVEYMLLVGRVGRKLNGGVDPWFARPLLAAIDAREYEDCAKVRDMAHDRLQDQDRATPPPSQVLEVPATPTIPIVEKEGQP